MSITALATLATVASHSSATSTTKPQPAVVLRGSPAAKSPKSESQPVRAKALNHPTPATVISKSVTGDSEKTITTNSDRLSPTAENFQPPRISNKQQILYHQHPNSPNHQIISAHQQNQQTLQNHCIAQNANYSQMPISVQSIQQQQQQQYMNVPMYYTQLPMSMPGANYYPSSPHSMPMTINSIGAHPSQQTMMMIPTQSMSPHHTAMTPTMMPMSLQSHPMSLSPHHQPQYAYHVQAPNSHLSQSSMIRTIPPNQPIHYMAPTQTMMFHPTQYLVQ